MGTVFLWLFMAWLFKGFGKAMTHSGGKKRKESWDGLSYEQKAWLQTNIMGDKPLCNCVKDK